jgi:UDP-GlcNAc:undecaprenyl-phosphate GlcNAc-1-phosphate transferase
MIAGVLPVLLVAAWADRSWGVVLAALVPVTALGLYKDRIGDPVSPFIQLLIQGGAALILLAGGLRLDLVPHRGLDAALSVVACLWVVNAWNFVDVADGLAGSLAVVSAFGFVACFLVLGDRPGAAVLGALAGASVAFLRFNRPPARIFMGDVGSFSLGVLFSASALLVGRGPRSAAGALVLLGLPLLDVALSASRRLRAGRSPLRGGAEHLSLRLLAHGWGATRLLAAACLVSLALGAMGFAAAAGPELARALGYRN